MLQKIFTMTPMVRKKYFEQLSREQLDIVYAILHKKARPPATCDLFDADASFADWITSHFFVPELDGPIDLAPYQVAALNEATKKDENGMYAYSLIAWMDIKKSIKSCIAAAVALRMAFIRDWASIKVVANKRDQAKSRSYFYITRSLKLNPETQKMLANGDIKINNYTISLNFNNSTIKALPLNPEGEAGGNDDLIIWTEAWAAKTKAAQTMYTEMVIPPNKFGQGFKWLESYAGFSGASPILEPIYTENVKDEHRIRKSNMYSNGRTFVLCNHEPRLPWQTDEYYVQQSKELTESEFNRVHRNRWQSPTDKFIDGLQWDLCKGKIPPLKKGDKLVLALDVGLKNDNFSIVGVNKLNGKIAVRIVKVWKPVKGQTLKFTNPTGDKSKDVEYPYGFIKFLCKTFKVVALRYDPYQAEKLAEDLTLNRIVNCEPFNQGAPRERADKYLYDIIRDQEIIHDGNTTLSHHIKNANAHHKGNNKIRLVKRNNSLKIDAAVALSMAAYTVKDFRL